MGPHQGVGSPFQMEKTNPMLTSKNRQGHSKNISLGLVREFSERLFMDQTFPVPFFILQAMPKVIQIGCRAQV